MSLRNLITKKAFTWLSASTCALFVLFFLTPAALAGKSEPLKFEKSIPLPGVRGRIDHMALDIDGERLFIAALGNNSVEVINLKTGERTESIKGLVEPQGVLYVPEFDRIFVTNAGDGTCRVFDGHSYNLIQTIDLSSDADNVRYDPLRKQVYIGYGEGAIAVVDAKTGERIDDIKLPVHPEAFQLEHSGSKIFINLPEAGTIGVIDRKSNALIKWPVSGVKGNFPMALDESGHRLFVGFRKPAKLIIYDTESGKPDQTLDISTDPDDLFYDSLRNRIYVSCGEGYVFVFQGSGNGRYEPAAKVTTAPGARTSLFVPETGRFYVAVPKKSRQPAKILVYSADHG